ncbi:hypothetical protein KVT40_006379 [Elsinoe batatas]|uniref:Zn(2)-C6 fungal-type domain-containing protein n=1 Tax=Elsinoe batatas TaxID=2601811 RepID=A0A8K0PG46_9PEZI|nr:hypothetical protein KVT40_006379 [Elsinoe batatas]
MAQPPKLPSVQQLEAQPPPAINGHSQQPSQPPQLASTPPQPHAPTLPPLQAHTAPPQPGVNGGPIPPPQHQHQPPMYANGHPPPPPASQYIPNGTNGVNGTSNGHHRVLYPIPPQNGTDTRTTKREIKRRTKTGCLTCRKRRIKCDEGHPACRNCSKSKRECLGYDPIFKSSGLTPPVPREGVHIQAAPPAYPVAPPSAQLPPPGYQGLPPPPQAHVPSLAGAAPRGDPSPAVGLPPESPHDPSLDPALKTTPGVANVPSLTPPPVSSDPYTSELRIQRRRQDVRMDTLSSIKGLPQFQPMSPTQLPEADINEVKSLYLHQHAPALNVFFETTWYTDVGDRFLFTHPNDVQFFLHASRTLRTRPPPPHPSAGHLPAYETKLIWLFATLPRVAWEIHQSADGKLADLLHRLDVVEHLITGAILPINLVPPAPLAPPNPGRDNVPPPDFVSNSFWHHLGLFTAQDDTSQWFNLRSHTHRNLTESMNAMRQILSVLENRDVLYSIAVARHIGGRLKRLETDLPPTSKSADPEEPLNKFNVAWKFLADEEMGGTTGVVRSMASLGRKGLFKWRPTEPPEGDDICFPAEERVL